MSGIRTATGTNLRILIAAIAMSCVASILWASVAQAQENPFDSQYAPPPTAPPTSEAVPPTAPAPPEEVAPAPVEGAVVSEDDDGEAVVDLLPTTGGSYLAPILLGGAVVSATALVAVRRIRK